MHYFSSRSTSGPVDGLITIFLFAVAGVCGYQLYHLLSGSGDWFFGTTGIELANRAINVQIIAFLTIGAVCLSIATGVAIKKVSLGVLILLAVLASGKFFNHNNSVIKRPESLPPVPGPQSLTDGSLVSTLANGAAQSIVPAKAESCADEESCSALASEKGYKRKTDKNGKHIRLSDAGETWCAGKGTHSALTEHAKKQAWTEDQLGAKLLNRDLNCGSGYQYYKASK